MSDRVSMEIIARMKSDFPTKFGIPRQSGLVKDLQSTIIFEEKYRNPDALRGLLDYSHIWLIWQFSGAVREGWSPTVRPPRLGGNVRMGVFATRSPFRPNEIGLSSVKLEGIEHTKDWGTVVHVSGADLMDGTPIFDIKPYLPYGDSHVDATGGFTDSHEKKILQVEFPESLLALVAEEKKTALVAVLENDPRPSYQDDPSRVYGLAFGGQDIGFSVDGDILTVLRVEKLENS